MSGCGQVATSHLKTVDNWLCSEINLKFKVKGNIILPPECTLAIFLGSKIKIFVGGGGRGDFPRSQLGKGYLYLPP